MRITRRWNAPSGYACRIDHDGEMTECHVAMPEDFPAATASKLLYQGRPAKLRVDQRGRENWIVFIDKLTPEEAVTTCNNLSAYLVSTLSLL